MTDTRSAAVRTRLAAIHARQPRAWSWAALSAAAAAVVAYLADAGAAESAMLVILGFGLGALGYVDQMTRIILNRHTGVFAVIVSVTLVAVQVCRPGDWVLVGAAFAAATAFAAMVVLVFVTGFASGGDIKLVPVMAAGLSLLSPLLPMLWLLLAFIACLAAVIVRRRRSVPMAPLMAVSLPVSVGACVLLYSLAGINF